MRFILDWTMCSLIMYNIYLYSTLLTDSWLFAASFILLVVMYRVWVMIDIFEFIDRKEKR